MPHLAPVCSIGSALQLFMEADLLKKIVEKKNLGNVVNLLYMVPDRLSNLLQPLSLSHKCST